MGKKLSLQDCQRSAEKKGGRCLSYTYIDNRTKLEWECAEQHTWKAIPNSIRSGYWCPTCAKCLKHTMKTAEEAAIAVDSTCVSEFYNNSKEDMLWKCNKKGHIWTASLHDIKLGVSCRTCRQELKITLETCINIAKSRDGECLSTNYVNSSTKMTWKCNKDQYIWDTTYNSIQRGSWCLMCIGRVGIKFSDIQYLIGSRAIIVEFDPDVTSKSKITLQCNIDGYIWNTRYNRIRNKHWCPKCAQKSKSKGEDELYIMVKNIYKDAKPGVRGLLKHKRLEMDIWIPSLMIGIEFDGPHHFNPIHGQKRLNQQVANDRLKDVEAAEAGIKLIRIHYIEYSKDPNKIKAFIINELSQPFIPLPLHS